MKSTAKFAAYGIAAMLLASCSDETGNGTNGNLQPTDLSKVVMSLVANNDASLTNRVHSYKTATAKARSRVAADPTTFAGVLDMPVIPAVTGVELLKPTDLVDGKTYQISGKEIDLSGKTIKNNVIYVNGGATLVYDESKGGNTFYILKGGKIKFAGTGKMLAATDKLVCEQGSVECTGNDVIVDGEFYANLNVTQKDGTVHIQEFGANTKYSEEDSETHAQIVVPSQNITFNNKTYIDGYVRAITLTIGKDAVANIKQNIMFSTTVNVNGKLHASKYFKTSTLNINGAMSSDWAVRAGNLNLNDGATLTADYVRATDAVIAGTGKLYVGDKGVLTFDKLTTDNTNEQIVLNAADAVAVIKADEFHNTGAETIKALSTPKSNATFLIQFTKSYNGSTAVPTFEDLDITASYLDYDKATDGKQVNESTDKWGVYTWTGDAANLKDVKKLDIVASIDPSDNQSATCIQPYDGKLYVSYHSNEEASNVTTPVSGSIEVATFSDNNITINQSVKFDGTAESKKTDFNHIAVAGNKLYAAGHTTEQGGLVAAMTLSGGTIDLAKNADVAYVDKKTAKNSYDANCVAVFGNNVVAASTRGYEVFDADFATHSYIATSGKAKYLAVANGKLYALNFSSSENKAADINLYDANMTVSGNYSVGDIAPDDGKDVIAVDGTDVYVCKGENGVSRFDASGAQKWNWAVPTISNTESEKYGYAKGYANGLAVDNNYVYVACGGYGVVVLDKTTGKEICHRKSHTGKSANYVAVDASGNIYVAYGQSRIQVFKLVGTK